MTREQVVQFLQWCPGRSWRIVATLRSLPSPLLLNDIYVREWISEISSSVDFDGYPEALVVTEISETHVFPLVHVLIGGTQNRYLAKHKETWENIWAEIACGSATIKCFREGKSHSAIRDFASRLCAEGTFYVELNLGFTVLQSADTTFYSKEWERLCVPVLQRRRHEKRFT
jgi:hypothetical protein